MPRNRFQAVVTLWQRCSDIRVWYSRGATKCHTQSSERKSVPVSTNYPTRGRQINRIKLAQYEMLLPVQNYTSVPSTEANFLIQA